MADELTALLGPSIARQQYQNPLFQAVTRQAFMGLPTYARNGLSLPSDLSSMDLSGLNGGTGGLGSNPALSLLTAAPAFAKLIPILQHLFNGGTTATAALGPVGSGGNPGMLGLPPFAGGSGGGSAAPGSNNYDVLTQLAANGISGMFYGGGGAGGGGMGMPGEQGYFGQAPFKAKPY